MTSTSPPTQESTPQHKHVRVASLKLRRIDPWSAMKTGLIFGIGLGLVWLVASILIFLFASMMGVFDTVNDTVADLSGDTGVLDLSLYQVVAINTVFAVIEVVVFTLVVGLLCVLYNAAAVMTGGIGVKLAED